MDMTHKILNVILPLLSVVLLIIILPPYYVFKLVSFVKRSIFSENMEGKVVLITGACAGIGEHMAYEYAKRKACLVLVDISEDRFEVVADRARNLGSPDVITIKADVSKIEDSKRFVDEAVNHYGRLDHLVNNAGVGAGIPFEKIRNIDKFLRIMNINFWGSVFSTHFALPYLKKTKGRIIAISSSMDWFLIPSSSFYSASKSAQISFFETLRAEFGSDIGITVVTPGLIKTSISHHPSISEVVLVSQEQCAKAIVNSACRGDRYLTEPYYFAVGYFVKAFCPEALEWFKLWVLKPTASKSRHATAKTNSQEKEKFIHTAASVHSPEQKTE